MRGDQAIEYRRPVSANVVPCEKGGGMYGCVAVEVEHGELPACRANLFAVGFASVPLIYGSNKFHQGNGRNCNVPRVVSNQTVNDSRHVSEVQNGDGRVDPESLNRFVASYQTVTTLKFGDEQINIYGIWRCS